MTALALADIASRCFGAAAAAAAAAITGIAESVTLLLGRLEKKALAGAAATGRVWVQHRAAVARRRGGVAMAVGARNRTAHVCGARSVSCCN